MEPAFNFLLNNKTLSKTCKSLGLTNFLEVCNYVQQLPYGRNKDRGNYTSIVKEQKGTCSTKHAFLRQIAIENDNEDIKLILGIYKMNESNTKGVGSILNNYQLDYIPEAHVYLEYNSNIYDFTSKNSNDSFAKDIMFSKFIVPEDIKERKVTLHKFFIKDWINSHNVNYTFKEIWQIREACITALST